MRFYGREEEIALLQDLNFSFRLGFLKYLNGVPKHVNTGILI